MKRKLETNEDDSNVKLLKSALDNSNVELSKSVPDSSNVKVSKSVPSFGSAFRKNLKTNNGINALNEFVLASKEKDVVSEYINSGGSAEELVNLLKQFDGKNNLIVAGTVFAALQLVVVKTVDDLLLIQNNVEKACEELLCSYHITLQNMLCSSSSITSYRKIVLKLLTGMVTLNAGLAKKILTLFPINLKLLRALTDSRASNSQLRTCFIHYLLSFLIDDNVFLISELLKIKGLLASIVSGLMNDKPETVILVLNTFRLKIVENVKISKTLKIHTFNTPVLRSLAKLYDYKSDNDSKESQSDSDLSVSVQSVRLAVHALLMLLCTSLKKGMLFRERGLVSGKSPNQLILTLLEDMNGPWRDELKSQLVTEILKVCPEFLKTVYNQLEPSVQPNGSADWRKLIIFLKEIIEKQELNIEFQKEQVSVALLTSSFFPAIVQKLLRDQCDDKILHQNPLVRFHILSLLEVCLGKIASFLEHCSPSLTDQSALKDNVEQFLSKNSASCVTLMNVWNTSVNMINEHLNLDISDYYNSLANVLLFYNQLCPISFKQLRLNEDVNLEKVDFCNSEIQFKRAQLMYFILNPKPLHDQFSSLLRQFLCSCIGDEKETKFQVLQNMFLSTGFFDGFVEEVLIWMYCIQKVPVEHTIVISDLLVDVFAAASKRYKNFLADVTSITSDDEVFFQHTHLTTDLEYFVDIDEGLECSTKPIILISPVIPALLSVLKSYDESANELEQMQSVKLFVLRILVHLSHLQSNVRGLIKLLKKYSSRYIDSSFLEYLNYWSHNKLEPESFMYPLPDEEMAYKVCSVISKSDCVVEDCLPLPDLTDTEFILLWNLCTFYSIKLNLKDSLRGKRCAYMKNVFSALREKLSLESRVRCLKFVISDLNFIDNFNLTGQIHKNSLFYLLLEICRDFQNHNSLPSYYSKLLSPYRQRLILFLLTKQRKNEPILLSSKAYTVDDMIQFVMLNSRTTALLLDTLTKLPLSLLVGVDQNQSSEWCAVIRNLLQISAEYLQHSMKNESLLRLLSKVKKLLASDVNVDTLETSIIKYLESFPHHITSIPEEISENLVECNPAVDKLALHLFPHHPSVRPIFLNKISEIGENADVDELFEVARKIAPVSSCDDILKTIHTHQYPLLISWIDGDCKWELQYANLVSEIFQKYAGVKICNRLCSKIKKKWPIKSLNVETCSVMNVIFEIANQTDEFVSLLISSLNDMLSSPGENVNWLCSSLSHVIEIVDNLNFLPGQDTWESFIKSALKISLQTSHAILLRTLRQICDKALTNDHTAETSIIFQMTISHSEFVNVILGNSETKCELIEFYLLLTSKNKSLMSSNHVPLLLGAYNASLSKSDQSLLQVLQWYEANKIRFSDCKPYLWGDAAVTHYSIRTEISVSLKRQPQPNQVLELLNTNIVKNTVRYGPLDRALQPEKELHLTDKDVYDLSFMLPLMSHLLAPESRVSVQKFTRSGALALVLAALSSQEAFVRMAGFHCLQRFQSHLNSREKEIQVWDHFISALKNGVLAIQPEDDNNTPPMLPCIVSNFLAHMSLIISEPLHSLYVPLTNFLLAKPSFDLNTIPNFLALFYSTDLKNRDHQEWILSIIRDGMRSEQDWITAQRCFLFKLILQYYSSASSNESTNVLVLEIMNNALKIPSCKVSLVTKLGMLSWLNQIIQNNSDFNKHFLSCLVNIFQSLKTVKNTSNVIFTILVLLRKLRSKIVDHQCIENLFEILSILYCYEKKKVFSKCDIEFIIDFTVPYHSSKLDKICRNCIIYSSVVGVGECDSNVTNYLIRMIQRFLSNK